MLSPQRHNGIDAWRRLAEPINDDKAMVRRDLLAAVTNPKGAASMDKHESAVEEWDTNIKLFVAADGEMMLMEEAKRMTLIQMLPIELSAYISMHDQLPDYKSLMALTRLVFQYVRTLRNLKRTGPRAEHLLEEEPSPLEVEEQEPEEEELMARLLATGDVEEQIEILAVMRQSGFRPPTRGQGGQRRLAPRNGPGAPRTGPAARTERTSPASTATGKAIRLPSANSRRWRSRTASVFFARRLAM